VGWGVGVGWDVGLVGDAVGRDDGDRQSNTVNEALVEPHVVL